MKTFRLLIIFIPILLSDIFSQGKILTFHKSETDIFAADPRPIPVAILPVSQSDSLICETLFNAMRNQSIILIKFEIYSYSDLLQQQKFFKIKNLYAYDLDCLNTLNQLLGIKHTITLTQINSGYELNIRNTGSGYSEFNNVYLDTDSSTAFKDLLKFFTDELIAEYNDTGRLNLAASPPDGKLTINAVQYKIPFDSTLEPGKYIINIKREGYRTIKDSVKIESGKIAYKNYYLEPSFGKLKINISPELAEYKIFKKSDSSFVKKGTGSISEIELQEGKYIVEINLTAFTSENRMFLVKEDEILEEIINLRRSFYPIEKFHTNKPDIAKNIKIFPQEYSYEIQYDLIGDKDDSYDIMLYLLNKNNPGQKLTVNKLSGDIGENIKSGNNKKIIWKIESKFDTHGIGVNDFSFYLEVD